MLPLELNRIGYRDQVTLFCRSRCQIQHKAGVEISEHLFAEFAPGMMTLIDDYER